MRSSFVSDDHCWRGRWGVGGWISEERKGRVEGMDRWEKGNETDE